MILGVLWNWFLGGFVGLVFRWFCGTGYLGFCGVGLIRVLWGWFDKGFVGVV